MAMNVKPEGSGSDPSPVAEINVTPLVDVMLVLLIIFMVTMPLMMSQLTITIPKPSRTPPPLDQKLPDPILVYVVRDGTGMQLSTKKGERCSVDPATVDATILQLRPDINKATELVTVSGQQLVDYGRVVNAVEHLGLRGFEKITLKEELDPYDPDPEVQRQLAAQPAVTSTACTPGANAEA